MSTEGRHVRVCRGTAPPPPQEALPVDLLLEIVAFADIATVVRCAATGRILRRAILDPAFRRRHALAHLLAVSYVRGQVYGGNVTTHTHRLIHNPDATNLPVCSLRDSFEPVASRDGLLVLRRQGDDGEHHRDHKVELRTQDILTGQVTSLPPTTLPYAGIHVVLSVGDARRSFELLVAHINGRSYRTFSSKDSQWSAVRQVFVPHTGLPWDSDCSAVIGRTVYLPRHVNACHWDHVLALDVDSGEATMMEIPAACFSRMMTARRDEHLLVAPVRGRLCVLVAESGGIAMWTLTSPVPSPPTWSRQAVISSLEIARQAGLPVSFTLKPLLLAGFGEGTRAVILNWEAGEMQFLRLDLGTKEEAAPAVVFKLGSPQNATRCTRYFLHEVQLVSLLQAMKSF